MPETPETSVNSEKSKTVKNLREFNPEDAVRLMPGWKYEKPKMPYPIKEGWYFYRAGTEGKFNSAGISFDIEKRSVEFQGPLSGDNQGPTFSLYDVKQIEIDQDSIVFRGKDVSYRITRKGRLHRLVPNTKNDNIRDRRFSASVFLDYDPVEDAIMGTQFINALAGPAEEYLKNKMPKSKS